MTFLEDLQSKLGPHNPEDVDQLILDDLFENVRVISDEMKQGIEKYKDLKHLSLNNFGLACLKNLPDLRNLEILEITDNHLNGKDFNLIVEAYPKLMKLKCCNNPIKSTDVFNVFNKSEIVSLGIYGTSIINLKNYREILFHKIKSLEAVDGVDREGYQVDSDFYIEEDSDAYEDCEEDKEYECSNDEEDEFDEDFGEESEDFELSQYDEDDNPDDIKNGTSKKKNKNWKFF